MKWDYLFESSHINTAGSAQSEEKTPYMLSEHDYRGLQALRGFVFVDQKGFSGGKQCE